MADVQAVAWYLGYPLSYRDLEEMFLERGFEVDHSTVNRWVLAYAPMIEKPLRQFRRRISALSGLTRPTSRSTATGDICIGPSTRNSGRLPTESERGFRCRQAVLPQDAER